MLENQVRVPVWNLYYENYTHDFAATTAQLLDFLELNVTAPPLEFIAGKTYPALFDDQQVVTIRKLLQTLASPRV